MIFQEPTAREDKPAADDIPQAIRAQIEKLLSARILSISVVCGGLSPSAGYKMQMDNGRSFFVKGSHPGEMSHATESLRQEVKSYQSIKIVNDIAPTCHGMVGDGDEDGWLLGVWDYIDPADMLDVESAVTALVKMQSDPKGAAHLIPAAQKNFIEMFFTTDRKWQRLKDEPLIRDKFLTLFADQSSARAWFDAHINLLCDLQKQIGDISVPHGLIHGDLRLDNVVQGADQKTYIIDWPNTCYGPMLFDTIFLAAHLAATGHMTMQEFFILHETSGGHHTAPKDRCIMMAAIAGFFADQAYRTVPPRLPRLRWMQKSMLAALLAGLSAEYDGIKGDSTGFAPIPQFSA